MAGTVAVKEFYIRRMLRIWPLYYLAIILGVVCALLPGGHRSSLLSMGWFTVFLGAQRTALTGMVNNPVSPMWSVSVEEQFYLLAPWAVKFLTRKMLYGCCAALVLLTNVWIYHLGSIHAAYSRIWADSLVQFECFAAGILLCLVLGGRAPMLAIPQRLLLIAICCGCWFAASYALHVTFVRTAENPGSLPLVVGYALVALGSVSMLVAFLGADPKRIPAWAVYLGRISYGLYAYHEFALYITRKLPIPLFLIRAVQNHPLRVCLNAGLTLGLPFGLTLLVTAFSYRYFETPFLKLKQRHSIVDSRPTPSAV